MGYLGNTPTTQNFISGTDYFNGDGSTTAFTLSRTVNSVNDIEAVINNVVQQPNTAYTLSGTTITFTSAPSAGTSNIYVRYLSTTTQVITPSQNTVSYSTMNTDMQGLFGQNFTNRIINGAMMIDQRNAGASVTPTSNNQYTLDRWAVAISASSKFSVQQSSTAPTGFNNSVLLTSLAATTVNATDYYQFRQRIEGYNVSDLGFGSANASTITISFWVRSSLTGTFSFSLINEAENRFYPSTYTINSANTWEQKTITIAGDVTGTWAKTNGTGMFLNFSLGLGSNYTTSTTNSWVSSNGYGVSSTTNFVATNGATFYITGVQLEKGSTATNYDVRSYGTELALCQRYYWKSLANSSYTAFGSGVQNASTTSSFYIKTPVTMRSSPTLSYSNVGSLTTGIASITAAGSLYAGYDSVLWQPAATGTAGHGVTLIANNNSSAYIDLTSEL